MTVVAPPPAAAAALAPPEQRDRSLGCAGCGHCCEEIHLNGDARQRLERWGQMIADGLPDPADDTAWRTFWTVGAPGRGTDTARPYTDDERDFAISTYGNAKWLATGKWQPVTPASPMAALNAGMFGTQYRCTVYDPVHRRCGDHANRPPICRLAPWYENDPAEQTARSGLPYPTVARDFPTGAPLGCSYHLDVPGPLRPGGARPLIPLEAVTR